MVADLGLEADFFVQAHAASASTKPAHVDLAGDGGGDQGGAAFLEQVDGTLGFGGEGVELRQSRDQEGCNGRLVRRVAAAANFGVRRSVAVIDCAFVTAASTLDLEVQLRRDMSDSRQNRSCSSAIDGIG